MGEMSALSATIWRSVVPKRAAIFSSVSPRLTSTSCPMWMMSPSLMDPSTP